MQPAICLLSVIPMRKEPAHRSEMVSQILFGEYVMVHEDKDDFVFVKCEYDGYEGWVQANQLTPVTNDQILSPFGYIAIHTMEIFTNEQSAFLPFGSPVYYSEKTGKDIQFGQQYVEYDFRYVTIWRMDISRPIEQVKDIAMEYLYVPYLWGGKSVFGIDCSGFVQQVYKLLGVRLPRDAYQQAEQGTAITSLDKARLGDLAFFRNEGGRVTHVGIILEESKIVHASGRVRIDTIDEKGIINSENGKRTHTMHSIRRIV